MQRQSIGGSQQHFEEDEKVEKIAGQERAIQAHQQELEERMEVRARAMPAREREHDRGGSQDAGQKQHEGREPIEDDDDGERSRPVAEPVNPTLADEALVDEASAIWSRAAAMPTSAKRRGDVHRGL